MISILEAGHAQTLPVQSEESWLIPHFRICGISATSFRPCFAGQLRGESSCPDAFRPDKCQGRNHIPGPRIAEWEAEEVEIVVPVVAGTTFTGNTRIESFLGNCTP